MIPKIIHYCWFGKNPLPESALKCIESWRRFFPDYEIKEWNESNFDVNVVPYTSEAYSIGKYAFVSDYARMWVLYHYGGVYFDTDVEVIRSFDDILEYGRGFMGFETQEFVAPGLGMALPKNSIIAIEVMDEFGRTRFLNEDGTFNPNGIVPITTSVLKTHGLMLNGKLQNMEGITIYPIEWFNPFDDATGRLRKTENTHSIHWYTKTWMKRQSKFRITLARFLHRIFGKSYLSKIKNSICR